MRRSWYILFAIVAVAVAACGGGTAGGEGSSDGSGAVIESGDGLATLTLPAGSLPEGVSIDDVQLETWSNETPESGEPIFAVLLLPDGLVLTEPATLTIALPETFEGGLMAIHTSGEIIEFLEGEFHQDDDGFLFTTSIAHFSVTRLFGDVFGGALTLTPERVSVDQEQAAHATITLNDPFSLWLGFFHEGGVRLYTFAIESQVRFDGTDISFDRLIDVWNPSRHDDVQVVDTSDGWEASASSTCLEPNAKTVLFGTQALLNVTLVDRGPREDRGIVSFSRSLGSESGYGRIPLSNERDDGVNLLELPVDSTFRAIVGFSFVAKTVCTAEEDSATDTEDPEDEVVIVVGEDPEGDGKTSDNSTQVTKEEDQPHADIQSVEHVVGSSGENCFIVRVYGEGGEDVSRYSIIVTAFDSAGGNWEARVDFEQGSTTSGKVFLRLREDGRTRLERLEGAEASMEWLDSKTIKVTVDGAGTALGVETFSVRTFGLNYYDDAEGAGAS